MCGACDLSIDQARAEGFAGEMVGTLNGGALAIMTSIGHRTALFDAMAKMPPAGSAEIAAAAGLDERCLREWLGAMVTGGIVECQPATGSYHLPDERLPPTARPLPLRTGSRPQGRPAPAVPVLV